MKPILAEKRVLLAVTGSIAAYKACDLVQRLREKGAEVRVVMTPSAAKLVHPNTFAALTGRRAELDAWEGASDGVMAHIELARWADLLVIAPCTAHTLAEIAAGLTGSLVSLIYLVFGGPVFLAPAMNSVMLAAPTVQSNLDRLRQKGDWVLPTDPGELACGEIGQGKLLEVNHLVGFLQAGLVLSRRHPLQGLKVLIALGHTREMVDDVRYLSNRSSGKTGLALARSFHLCGAEIELVAGFTEEALPEGFSCTRVEASRDFRRVLLEKHSEADVLVMAAAIADFVPARQVKGKLKRSKELQSLELRPSPDILQELGEAKPRRQVLVGFALETGEVLKRGPEKLARKSCDVMVLNDPVAVSSGFGRDSVRASVCRAGTKPPALREMHKEELADQVLSAVAGMRAGK